jgi:hypothetical protein
MVVLPLPSTLSPPASIGLICWCSSSPKRRTESRTSVSHALTRLASLSRALLMPPLFGAAEQEVAGDIQGALRERGIHRGNTQG